MISNKTPALERQQQSDAPPSRRTAVNGEGIPTAANATSVLLLNSRTVSPDANPVKISSPLIFLI